MRKPLLIAAALLALRPFAPAERVADLVTLPARVAAPLGLPATLVTRTRVPSTSGADPDPLAREVALSARLERAVLRSAWPADVHLEPHVAPIPGEVDARLGRSRDTIRVRLADPERVRVGQPVVAGDVYIGRVSRIPFREPRRDDPGPLERLMRAMGLSSPPLAAPRDAVDVALITGADQRVGGLVVEDQEGERCAMVVGGVAWPTDRTWLAVHAPERRGTSAGRVVVSEPLGLDQDFESLGEGFVIGELQREGVARPGEPFERDVLGIQPPIDFGAGINQVLVLASVPRGRRVDHAAMRDRMPVIPVLEDGGWGAARVFVAGDTSPWRSTLRIDRGSRNGLAPGAALVEGVRLAGRVSDPSPMTSAVSTLFDPGFRVAVLAQWNDAPDATPMAMGVLESEGRAADGRLLLRWRPDLGTGWPSWARDPEHPERTAEVSVTLWTGSGMARVPRGLRIGRAVIPAGLGGDAAEVVADAEAADLGVDGAAAGAEIADVAAESAEDETAPTPSAPEDGVLLFVAETATLAGPFQVRLGGARLSRPAGVSSGASSNASSRGRSRSGQVEAAERAR